MEKVGKNATTKMESSEIGDGSEMTLPYLEMEEYCGDRNLASVGETLEVSYFWIALPC